MVEPSTIRFGTPETPLSFLDLLPESLDCLTIEFLAKVWIKRGRFRSRGCRCGGSCGCRATQTCVTVVVYCQRGIFGRLLAMLFGCCVSHDEIFQA